MKLLRRALDGDLNAIVQLKREHYPCGEEELVTPADLAEVLRRFLRGSITGEDLTKWADCLVTRDEFVSPNWRDDTFADYYEPMWEIVQQLSTPALDGPITLTRAEQYIEKLDALQAGQPNI